MLPKEFMYSPTVFAIGKRYVFCISANCESTAWIQIGDRRFYDSSNGIMRSKSFLHKIEVPQAVLDDNGEYTVFLREYTDRKPYFPESNEPVCITRKFASVKADADTIKILHISDVHGKPEHPIKSVDSDYDLLVLNGDIADHSGNVKNFSTLFELAGKITNGEKPCVFSRGNHDLRGNCAEILSDYTPTDNGKSYYTFRLGSLWGIVLDCGEDKADNHPEYGNTVVCHEFRICETEFIKSIISNSSSEYEECGVKHKVLISHVPFAYKQKDPFNSEEKIYREWSKLVRDNIKPELWLAGHLHKKAIILPGMEHDDFGEPCTAVIASEPKFDKDWNMTEFISAKVVMENGKNTVIFNSSVKGEIEKVEI